MDLGRRGPAAELDHADPVVRAGERANLADPCLLGLLLWLLDAGRDIDGQDDRQAVVGPPEPGIRERQHEGGEHSRTEQERPAPLAGAEGVELAAREPEQQWDGEKEQEGQR